MITVNGDPFPWREGLTVSEVMKEKNFKFRLISVWVGDNFIDKERYAEVKIPDGADVQVIHNISGGPETSGPFFVFRPVRRPFRAKKPFISKHKDIVLSVAAYLYLCIIISRFRVNLFTTRPKCDIVQMLQNSHPKGRAAMDNNKVSWVNVIKFAGAVIAFLIGAGFATGQEVLQYIAGYG